MRSDRLTILAVDDERTQLEDLARLLRTFPAVEEVECAYDGQEALGKLAATRYDAVFLDVRMPDIDGVKLARIARRFATPPALVFVSAYDGAAVDAFELHALDYLRKPVSRARLEEAVERICAAVESGGADAPVGAAAARPPAPAAGDQIAVANFRTGGSRLVPRAAILYVQSNGDFVRIVTPDGRYLMRGTLAELERRLEPHGFLRVHRQYLANLSNAVEVRPRLGSTAELVFGDGQAIPIARRHISDLGRRLGV